MIEHHDSLRHVERMMIRDRDHPGAEADPMRFHRGRRQKHLRRRDRFPSRRMMLADPELVVAKVIEQCGKFKVAFQLERGMLAHRMMRSEEHTKTEPVFHGGSPWRAKRVLHERPHTAQPSPAGESKRKNDAPRRVISRTGGYRTTQSVMMLDRQPPAR